jgi:hypothetical protein
MHNGHLQPFHVVRALAALTLSFAAISCSSDTEPVESSQSDLTQRNWTFCANQDARCQFSGTHAVRYGRNGRYTVRTFSDGVLCSGAAFGIRRNSGSCDYDANGATMQPMAAGTGMTGMPGSMAAGAAGSVDHSMHGGAVAGSAGSALNMGAAGAPMAMPAAGAASMMDMPYVDTSAIPSGDPGSNRVQIEATSEQPVASDGVGAFRNECTFSHMNFDDPIVFPGKPGTAHLHTYFGNSAADASSTTDSIRNSGNSTCRGGTANRTAYWVPALLDAAGRPQKPRSLEVYYKSGYNGIKPADIKAFPSGLRIIAGSAKSSSAQRVAYWGCVNNYIGHPGSIPNCSAGDLLQMTIEFPQCWDGVHLDSTDHVSHVAYPQNGSCPSTHPVAIPAITFNVWYPMPSSGSTAGWHLASDMYDTSLPGGFSAHADWFDGWDPAVVKTFVERCINPALDCHSHLLGDGRAIY